MKGIQIAKLSDSIEDIKITDNLPVPELENDNDLLIEVKAAGVNFYDLLMVKGTYQIKQTLPFILGTEFSGVVLKVNNSNSKYKVGDRVFGSNLGAYVQYLVCDEINVLPMPSTLTFQQAATIFITFPTALAGLMVSGQLQKGQTVLIHGASGGVGIATIQMAKLLGAKVFATTTDPTKKSAILEAGADHVLIISKQVDKDKSWVEQVKQLTNDEGVDLVYDLVGLVNLSSSCTRFGGKIVVVGFTKGTHESVATNRILVKNISIVGLHWGPHNFYKPDTVKLIWDTLFKWFEEKKLIPTTFNQKFSLEQTQQALQLVKDRKVFAKVVITVNQDQPKL